MPTILVYTKLNKANARHQHQQILYQTENWLKANNLTLNTDKSKTTTFKTKHDRNDFFKMKGKPLENQKFLSYLGIMIDEKLDFREHMKRVEKNLVQFCGLFYKLIKILNHSQIHQDIQQLR